MSALPSPSMVGGRPRSPSSWSTATPNSTATTHIRPCCSRGGLPIGGDLIHAPTGAVLLQVRGVAIEGVTERVVDDEQPVFAWR